MGCVMELKDYEDLIEDPISLLKTLKANNEIVLQHYIRYAFELRHTIEISEEEQNSLNFLMYCITSEVIPTKKLKEIVTKVVLENTQISKEKIESDLDAIYNYIKIEEPKQDHEQEEYSMEYNSEILRFVWELVKQN